MYKIYVGTLFKDDADTLEKAIEKAKKIAKKCKTLDVVIVLEDAYYYIDETTSKGEFNYETQVQ